MMIKATVQDRRYGGFMEIKQQIISRRQYLTMIMIMINNAKSKYFIVKSQKPDTVRDWYNANAMQASNPDHPYEATDTEELKNQNI